MFPDHNIYRRIRNCDVGIFRQTDDIAFETILIIFKTATLTKIRLFFFRIPKVLSNMLTVVEIIALGEVLMIGMYLQIRWNSYRAKIL